MITTTQANAEVLPSVGQIEAASAMTTGAIAEAVNAGASPLTAVASGVI